MSSDILAAMLALIGVIIGAFLTFLTQYLLHRQQERTELRKQAFDVKNEQCLALWKVLSDTYQYLFFSGRYSEDKVDLRGLGEHIKELNVAVIKAEPFISHQSFLQLMEVRDAINCFFVELETQRAPTVWNEEVRRSWEEHMAFINKLEEPMNKAREVLRQEMQLARLDIFAER